MAINKKQSALWVKVTIVIIIVAFVGTAVPAAFLGGGGGGDVAPDGRGAALERLANTYAPIIASLKPVLESEPTSYTALVDMGDTYFEWGLEIRREFGITNPGFDLPMWEAASAHYERALAVRSDDPAIWTNLAITHYYAGRVSSAIEVIEAVNERFPEYAFAYFNAGIFYRTAGRYADSLTALERHIELAPDSETAVTAQTWITELVDAGDVTNVSTIATPPAPTP